MFWRVLGMISRVLLMIPVGLVVSLISYDWCSCM
jgi:hypothetical protein